MSIAWEKPNQGVFYMNNPVTDHITETIKEMDSLTCSHPASVNADVATVYYALTKMLRPLLVVEIGCFIGFSTLHFAHALKELGFGRIISIDAFDWEVDAGKGMQNRQIVAEDFRKKADLESVITYIKGYSTEVYAQISGQIKNKIDLLYIDGDHSVKGVFADFNTYYNDVRLGGYLILHDIYPSMCGVEGPRVLIDQLKASGIVPHQLELIEMQTRDGYGIALLRKVGNRHIQISCDLSHFWKKIFRKASKKVLQRWVNSARIVVKVIDAQTRRPISGATVLCPQRGDEYRVTGMDGAVHLDHYIPNRYLVDIVTTGYQDKRAVMMDVQAEKTFQEFIIEMIPEG
jgi:predicted O-methyltransferase YrrM